MRRREFITLSSCAAVALPLVARAQQGERMRRIAVLAGGAAIDEDRQERNTAFVQEFQKLGWTVGRNVQIDYRSGFGGLDALRRHAAEIVALAPDAILTSGTVSMAPLLQATRTVPMVFTNVADPVGAGFVKSLSKPGGNATGL